LASQRSNFTLKDRTVIKIEDQGTMGVGIQNLMHPILNRHIYPQFLLQLTPKTGLKGFPWIPFPSRKLPQPCEHHITLSLRNEIITLPANNTRCNFHNRAGSVFLLHVH
jgi:hypothetical protein